MSAAPAVPDARLGRGLRTRVRELWTTLVREGRTPGRVAAAIVAGSVIGWSPLFGFHLLLTLLVGRLLRLNRLVMYATAQISIPPLAPFLGFLSIQAGHRLLHGRWVGASLHEFRRRGIVDLAADFLWSWLVGGFVLGLVTGVAAAGVALVVLQRRRERRFPRARRSRIRAALRRTRARYAALHPRMRWHVAAKSRMDPCYRAACAVLPARGRIFDLGSGLGILPIALAELWPDVEVVGVEHDGRRLVAALEAARGLSRVRLEEDDLRTVDLPSCSAIVLLDVLHYFAPLEQRSLLARAAAALEPGGRLVVREQDGARGTAAAWTRLVERLSVRCGWNRAGGVRFRPASEIRAELEALGLRVRTVDASGCLPGNVLLCGRKPAHAIPAPGVPARASA